MRVLREGAHYFIAGGIMFTVLILPGRILAPSMLNTAIMVLSGAAVYFLILLLLRDDFFISNVKKILKAIPFFR